MVRLDGVGHTQQLGALLGRGGGGGGGPRRVLREQVAWSCGLTQAKLGLGASTTPLHGATTHHRLKQRAVDDKHGEHEDAGGEPAQHEHWGAGSEGRSDGGAGSAGWMLASQRCDQEAGGAPQAEINDWLMPAAAPVLRASCAVRCASHASPTKMKVVIDSCLAYRAICGTQGPMCERATA